MGPRGVVDHLLIRKKLQELKRYTAELERFRGQDLSTLRQALATQWSVEHGLQLAVQTVLDVGSHILAAIGESRIEEYVDVIDRLGERGILPKPFAQHIRDMVGFRNILVHEYADVDVAIVHEVLQHRLADFDEFCRHIEQYLTAQGKP